MRQLAGLLCCAVLSFPANADRERAREHSDCDGDRDDSHGERYWRCLAKKLQGELALSSAALNACNTNLASCNATSLSCAASLSTCNGDLQSCEAALSAPLLHFGVTGDTRPTSLDDFAGYPAAIINSIADHFQASAAQFVVDTGNHSFANTAASANQQMALYLGATKRFSNRWYLAEGDHDCLNSSTLLCLPGSQAPSFLAFLQALNPVSSMPYYTFDVPTPHGQATFVVIAGNSWDATQAAWLEQTLSAADLKAKYTIVISNHPLDSTFPNGAAITAIVRGHKFALVMSDHLATYLHPAADSGRGFILGLGGAPLSSSGVLYGYGIIDQLPSGLLQVSVFDLNGAAQDLWTTGPN